MAGSDAHPRRDGQAELDKYQGGVIAVIHLRLSQWRNYSVDVTGGVNSDVSGVWCGEIVSVLEAKLTNSHFLAPLFLLGGWGRRSPLRTPLDRRHWMLPQKSCAIAKMTAQCTLYMGALKIFGTP